MRPFAPSLIVTLFVLLPSPADAEPPRWETVYGLATVNGRSKRAEGKTYHLVALYFDPKVLLLGSNTTDTECLVNGKPLQDCTVTPTPPEKLRGKHDPRINLTWMALPEKGELEVLCGAVHYDKPRHSFEEKRKQMLKGGFVPYKVEVGKITAVKAATLRELAESMEKQFGEH